MKLQQKIGLAGVFIFGYIFIVSTTWIGTIFGLLGGTVSLLLFALPFYNQVADDMFPDDEDGEGKSKNDAPEKK